MAEFLKNFGTHTIHLCHVLGEEKVRGRDRDRAGRSLQQIQDKLQDMGFQAETHVTSGEVADQVHAKARDLQVDYVCLKWRRKNVLRRTILGSADVDILRAAERPIFLYKPSGLFETRMRMQNVLYATDLRHTDRVVPPYLQAASHGAQHLYVLHVRERAPDPDSDQRRDQEVKVRLRRLCDRYCEHYEQVEPLTAIGSARRRIPQMARSYDADLIVIGKRDPQNPRDRIMGSTAEAVPYHAHCSLLIVP